MNQERFDELTRALATGRVSRGRMLKAVAAAALGGTLGGWGSLLRSEGAEAKEKPKDKCAKKCPGGAEYCTTSGVCCEWAACGNVCWNPLTPGNEHLLCCNGNLINKYTNSQNCCRCGNQCPSGTSCGQVEGVCGCIGCSDGKPPCGNTCCGEGTSCVQHGTESICCGTFAWCGGNLGCCGGKDWVCGRNGLCCKRSVNHPDELIACALPDGGSTCCRLRCCESGIGCNC
jgi:hypothetical protein